MVMQFIGAVRNYWGAMTSPAQIADGNPAEQLVTDLDPATQYDLLRAYYLNNRLYEWLAWAFSQEDFYDPNILPVMNPAYRAVEFHAAHLWPGRLDDCFELVTKTPAVADNIRQMWKWGNWGGRKQVAARWAGLYGDMWIKMVQSDDLSQVFQQLIEPQFVTDFQEDDAGRRFLRWIRMDTPRLRDPRLPRWQDNNRYWVTEVWDKDNNVMLRWDNNTYGPDKPLNELGPPDVEIAMMLPSRQDQTIILPDGRSVERLQFGFDFIPIVHAPFIDIGMKRGVGCFSLSLAKIDKLNEIATNLLGTMFPNIVWALTKNSTDKTGRPTPALRIDNRQIRSSPDAIQLLTLPNGEQVWSIPGDGDLKPLIPDTPLLAQKELLVEYQHELERDMPELAYARLTQQELELSGKAIRLLLSGAIDRELEARGNLHPALIRSHEMGLTMGSLPGGPFKNIGTYESGAFEHSFVDKPVLAPSPEERLEEEQQRVDIATGKKLAGWDRLTIFMEFGYTEAEAKQIMDRQDQEAATAAEQFANTLAGPDAGGDTGEGDTPDQGGSFGA